MTRCQAAGDLEAIDFYSAYNWTNLDFIYSENGPLSVNVPVPSTYDGNT